MLQAAGTSTRTSACPLLFTADDADGWENMLGSLLLSGKTITGSQQSRLLLWWTVPITACVMNSNWIRS